MVNDRISKKDNLNLFSLAFVVRLSLLMTEEARDWHKQASSKANLVGSHESLDLGLGLDVAEIGCDSGRVHDVVQVQLRHCRVQLQQHGQRLSDP